MRGPKIIYGAYIGNICESPSWVIIWRIFWVVCRKYLCGPKIVYGLVWVFFSKWANEIRARKFVPQHLAP